MQEFFAQGKLLLTAEYTVLKGALALAIPTKYGQKLTAAPLATDGWVWQSFDSKEQVWFECIFDRDFEIKTCTNRQTAEFLQSLMRKALSMSTLDYSQANSSIKTYLDFPNNWGLGSSSTLISLVAQYFGVDALTLFFETTSGSGYDVACATAKQAITYQLQAPKKALVTSITLPEIFEQAKFIHLNKKQRSLPEVKRFLASTTNHKLIEAITEISQKVEAVTTKDELCELLKRHEEITAKAIGIPPVKEKLFPDFKGTIKSLGAWGGDFVLAIGSDVPSYFKAKGYSTIIDFRQMYLAN